MLAILSSILFFSLSSARAEDLICGAGKIVLVEFGQEKIEKSVYCFNKNKNVLISKSCLKKNCRAFEDKRKFKLDELLSPMGKPSFRLCRELSGKPELLEFYVENKSYKLDRCLFNDGSFVDTDFLLSHYLER